MTLVTFVIAMAAIGAFYFYSTKPACREAVNSWSVAARDALQGRAIQSSGQFTKRKVRTANATNLTSPMQYQPEPKEVSANTIGSGSTISSGSTGSQLGTGTSDDEKAEGAIRAGTTPLHSSTLIPEDEGQPSALPAGATATGGAPEKRLLTGEKKKKKKSKGKKSKKRKNSKGSNNEGESKVKGGKKKKKKKSKKLDETLPDDIQ
ncbi:unnamed protein product [Litomosoides sigmodontis]|uniref:Uncharacterized protein n=1 Tax=Litomosoides sigmodontis TaxID=42156 RepID=A0A3P6T7X5_LITSI|nr:unnamed protein product [Litomosoides sigmodontis]